MVVLFLRNCAVMSHEVFNHLKEFLDFFLSIGHGFTPCLHVLAPEGARFSEKYAALFCLQRFLLESCFSLSLILALTAACGYRGHMVGVGKPSQTGGASVRRDIRCQRADATVCPLAASLVLITDLR